MYRNRFRKKKVEGDSISNKTLTNQVQQDASYKVPDFLALSKNENAAYNGFLQGVDRSDSSGPYIYSEYFSDSLSFQLFFVPKYQEKDIITFDSIRRAATSGYRDYFCLAFVYPMQDPDKMEDYHADNVVYPVNVKCYVRKDRIWEFLSESQVIDLTDLSQFKIRCIYSIHNTGSNK